MYRVRSEVGMVEAAGQAPWNDSRFVVEGLEAASCGPHAKTLAIEGIEIASEGGTADDWRAMVAERHHDHPGWPEHLAEAERCMRSAGIWPWQADRPRQPEVGA